MSRRRRAVRVLSAAAVLGLAGTAVTAAGTASAAPPVYTPGAAGVGDPYFPLDGNGGYDVGAYDLELGYDPDTDVLTGLATIALRAKRNLTRFNFDLDGLTVSHPQWWFNLRASNTEPLLRLNVEGVDATTMTTVRDEVSATIRADRRSPT